MTLLNTSTLKFLNSLKFPARGGQAPPPLLRGPGASASYLSSTPSQRLPRASDLAFFTKFRTAGSRETGFTILELLMVMGIASVLGGMALFLSMDFSRGYSFNYEENLLVGALQRARSQAMANVSQAKHGVCVIGTNYVISEGDTCTSGDTFPMAPSMTVAWSGGASAAAIFNQVDGTCVTCSPGPLKITLAGQGKTASISINAEGQINW